MGNSVQVREASGPQAGQTQMSRATACLPPWLPADAVDQNRGPSGEPGVRMEASADMLGTLSPAVGAGQGKMVPLTLHDLGCIVVSLGLGFLISVMRRPDQKSSAVPLETGIQFKATGHGPKIESSFHSSLA